MNLILQDKNIYRNFVFILANISVFLFFALLLPTKSGHSIAIIAGLTACILSIPLWEKNKITKEIKLACFFLLFLGLFWSHTFNDIFSISLKGDYLLRYLIGTFFLISFTNIGIHKKSITYGIAIGAVLSGLVAIYQSQTIGRAEGFTNAVRFGNIGMMMFLICLTASLSKYFSNKERIFYLITGIFGLITSILSLSRGGWLILLIIPTILLLLIKNRKIKILSLVISIPLIFAFASVPPVEKRIDQAKDEVIGYINNRDNYIETSIGARLEQWKTAFLMGLEKPLSGWGDQELKNGKVQFIEQGISDPSIMNYHHAHNDFLEQWARRGIIGVFTLIIIYTAPIYLLRSSTKKINDQESRFFIITGIIIYFGYFISGLTSVFFTFVISHNFYLFSFIFLLSASEYKNSIHLKKIHGNS
ncbi:O-antigen ligase family protein [Comamonas denitrificans]|uniref:O-antigen ligase family protein n=1 Tax=Comamonas denitrificans TaxID=117506 RepID=UPI00360D6F68